MAPQWSVDEDRALLLALVQVIAPNGPSKHQFEAVLKTVNDRWTIGAATQHYNKKLRLLDPATLGLSGDTSKPSTPVRTSASAIKRKAPTPRTAPVASPSPSPAFAASSGRTKKKNVAPKAIFPNLRTASNEAAPTSSLAEFDEDNEDEDEEQVASKKVKVEDGEVEE